MTGRRIDRGVRALAAGCAGALCLLAAAPALAAYPGRNGAVVFTSVRDAGTRHVFLRGRHGTRDLTGARSPAMETDPEFSPDGRRIAFTRADASNGQIVVMDVDGRHRRQLTHTPTGNGDPTWSPDGRRIAFVSERSGEPDVYVMRTDGTHVRRITGDAAAESDLAWSPRGDRIAFVREPAGGGDRDIWAMRPDGGGARDLTHDPEHPEAQPDFSPDGRWIVYQGPAHPTGSVGGDLWVMAAGGGAARPLRHERNGASDGGFPAWSPDGTTIAFAANDGTGWAHVWSVPAGGGQNDVLIADRVPGGNPVDEEVDWQPLVPRAAVTGARVGAHRAAFRFRAAGRATGFRCAVARQGARWRLRPCRSPRAYRALRPGRYAFAVLAVGVPGSQPWPTIRPFRIPARRSR